MSQNSISLKLCLDTEAAKTLENQDSPAFDLREKGATGSGDLPLNHQSSSDETCTEYELVVNQQLVQQGQTHQKFSTFWRNNKSFLEAGLTDITEPPTQWGQLEKIASAKEEKSDEHVDPNFRTPDLSLTTPSAPFPRRFTLSPIDLTHALVESMVNDRAFTPITLTGEGGYTLTIYIQYDAKVNLGFRVVTSQGASFVNPSGSQNKYTILERGGSYQINDVNPSCYINLSSGVVVVQADSGIKPEELQRLREQNLAEIQAHFPFETTSAEHNGTFQVGEATISMALNRLRLNLTITENGETHHVELSSKIIDRTNSLLVFKLPWGRDVLVNADNEMVLVEARGMWTPSLAADAIKGKPRIRQPSEPFNPALPEVPSKVAPPETAVQHPPATEDSLPPQPVHEAPARVAPMPGVELSAPGPAAPSLAPSLILPPVKPERLAPPAPEPIVTSPAPAAPASSSGGRAGRESVEATVTVPPGAEFPQGANARVPCTIVIRDGERTITIFARLRRDRGDIYVPIYDQATYEIHGSNGELISPRSASRYASEAAHGQGITFGYERGQPRATYFVRVTLTSPDTFTVRGERTFSPQPNYKPYPVPAREPQARPVQPSPEPERVSVPREALLQQPPLVGSSSSPVAPPAKSASFLAPPAKPERPAPPSPPPAPKPVTVVAPTLSPAPGVTVPAEPASPPVSPASPTSPKIYRKPVNVDISIDLGGQKLPNVGSLILVSVKIMDGGKSIILNNVSLFRPIGGTSYILRQASGARAQISGFSDDMSVALIGVDRIAGVRVGGCDYNISNLTSVSGSFNPTCTRKPTPRMRPIPTSEISTSGETPRPATLAEAPAAVVPSLAPSLASPAAKPERPAPPSPLPAPEPGAISRNPTHVDISLDLNGQLPPKRGEGIPISVRMKDGDKIVVLEGIELYCIGSRSSGPSGSPGFILRQTSGTRIALQGFSEIHKVRACGEGPAITGVIVGDSHYTLGNSTLNAEGVLIPNCSRKKSSSGVFTNKEIELKPYTEAEPAIPDGLSPRNRRAVESALVISDPAFRASFSRALKAFPNLSKSKQNLVLSLARSATGGHGVSPGRFVEALGRALVKDTTGYATAFPRPLTLPEVCTQALDLILGGVHDTNNLFKKLANKFRGGTAEFIARFDQAHNEVRRESLTFEQLQAERMAITSARSAKAVMPGFILSHAAVSALRGQGSFGENAVMGGFGAMGFSLVDKIVQAGVSLITGAQKLNFRQLALSAGLAAFVVNTGMAIHSMSEEQSNNMTFGDWAKFLGGHFASAIAVDGFAFLGVSHFVGQGSSGLISKYLASRGLGSLAPYLVPFAGGMTGMEVASLSTHGLRGVGGWIGEKYDRLTFPSENPKGSYEYFERQMSGYEGPMVFVAVQSLTSNATFGA